MTDTPEVTQGQEEALRMIQDPNNIIYACLMIRPGIDMMIQDLEDSHYPPSTKRNDLFNLVIIVWEQLPWNLVIIPKDERGNMDTIAYRHNFRVTDGVPTMLSNKGSQTFPFSGKNVFTIESNGESPQHQ